MFCFDASFSPLALIHFSSFILWRSQRKTFHPISLHLMASISFLMLISFPKYVINLLIYVVFFYRELFSGVNSGINFGKYEEIPVEASGSDVPPPCASVSIVFIFAGA